MLQSIVDFQLTQSTTSMRFWRGPKLQPRPILTLSRDRSGLQRKCMGTRSPPSPLPPRRYSGVSQDYTPELQWTCGTTDWFRESQLVQPWPEKWDTPWAVKKSELTYPGSAWSCHWLPPPTRNTGPRKLDARHPKATRSVAHG